MLHYAKHPFPEDIEELLRKLNARNPKALNGDVALFAYDWEQGTNLDEGRQLLTQLLAKIEGKN